MMREMIMLAGSDLDSFYHLEAFPQPGDACLAVEQGVQVGGCVLNAAAVAAAKGIPVAVADCLKADDAGTALIVDTLKHHGVNPDLIATDPEAVNGRCLIMECGGEKIIYVIEPRRPAYAVDERFQQRLSGASYIYSLMHIMLQSFADPEPLRKARQDGARIVFDGASQYTDPREAELLKQLADGLFLNRQAYRRLCAALHDEAAEVLLKGGAQFVCVTAGAQGADCHTAEGTFHQDAYPVAVVDSTGAGDSFAGAFLAARAKGYPWAKALDQASRNGAAACLKPGGMAGAVGEEELYRLI